MHTLAWLVVAGEWAIRLAMIFYVPQKRTPAAARTWLLLIFIEPWLGLFLYWLFGRIYLPQKRIEHQQRVSQTLRVVSRDLLQRMFPPPHLPAQFSEATKLAEKLGDFSILGGNRIELISDYDEAIQRLIDDIDAAAHHVHLLFYIFENDRTGRRVAEAVMGAAQRGVKCRLLLDSVGAKSGLAALGPELLEAGVEICELLPVRFFQLFGPRMDLRNHRKLAVIDGHVAFVGSQNIVDAQFSEDIINEELVARVTGPVVMQLQAVFLTDRFLESGESIRDPAFFPTLYNTGTSPAQVVPSGPGYPHANNQRVMISLLHAARTRVVLTTPYFVPDEPLLHALTSAALRGVEVHLVVSQKIDHFLVGWAQRSYYEELLENGIQIHAYQPGLLHAKHLSVDDTVSIIGSSNLDVRSFLLNAEISLVVYDPAVAQALRRVQEQNFANSQVLTAEEWQNRPFFTKLLHNIARLVDALL